MAVNYDEQKKKVPNVDYDAIEKANLDKAQQQQADYSSKRQQALDSYVSALTEANRVAQEATRQEYEQGIEATRRGYQSAYDKNAIAERIGRKNVAETLSDLGLTDSGLNRTQQTALSVARAKADSDTTLQREAAVDALAGELSRYIAENEANLAGQKAQAASQAQQDVLNNWTTLFENAQNLTQNRYTTERNLAVEELAARIANEQFGQQMAQSQSQFEQQVALSQQQALAEQNAEMWNDENKAETAAAVAKQYASGTINALDLCNALNASALSDEDVAAIADVLGVSQELNALWEGEVPTYDGSLFREWFQILQPAIGNTAQVSDRDARDAQIRNAYRRRVQGG